MDTWATGRIPCPPRIGHKLSRLTLVRLYLVGDPEDLWAGQPLLVGPEGCAARAASSARTRAVVACPAALTWRTLADQHLCEHSPQRRQAAWSPKSSKVERPQLGRGALDELLLRRVLLDVAGGPWVRPGWVRWAG
jgi:hypothetical protein